MAGKSWSFAHDRRAIELAKASKSLEEAARIMKRTPERIRKVALRLGVSFKPRKRNSLPPALPQPYPGRPRQFARNNPVCDQFRLRATQYAYRWPGAAPASTPCPREGAGPCPPIPCGGGASPDATVRLQRWAARRRRYLVQVR